MKNYKLILITTLVVAALCGTAHASSRHDGTYQCGDTRIELKTIYVSTAPHSVQMLLEPFDLSSWYSSSTELMIADTWSPRTQSIVRLYEHSSKTAYNTGVGSIEFYVGGQIYLSGMGAIPSADCRCVSL